MMKSMSTGTQIHMLVTTKQGSRRLYAPPQTPGAIWYRPRGVTQCDKGPFITRCRAFNIVPPPPADRAGRPPDALTRGVLGRRLIYRLRPSLGDESSWGRVVRVVTLRWRAASGRAHLHQCQAAFRDVERELNIEGHGSQRAATRTAHCCGPRTISAETEGLEPQRCAVGRRQHALKAS